jgi:ligand-binding SRPBCC domain-containing protein
MITLVLKTEIQAPLDRCFDLARSIDFHIYSLHSTGERVIAGVNTGLIGLGEEVTWAAKHFGIRQTLHVKITALDYPHHFRDSLVKGAFKSLDHDHFFSTLMDKNDKNDKNDKTLMEDHFHFASPYGLLGKAVDIFFLKRYMTRLLEERNQHLKQCAESEEWRRFLSPPL